jgi:hypothetical protein
VTVTQFIYAKFGIGRLLRTCEFDKKRIYKQLSFVLTAIKQNKITILSVLPQAAISSPPSRTPGKVRFLAVSPSSFAQKFHLPDR